MPLGMLGKYERLDVLGHGVSGIVYLARDTYLNKQVALKEVDVQAGDMARFLEEARLMDRLRHPNIARVNGVDRIEGKIVIDMEYVRGRNLQEILRESGPLPLDRALGIAIQVLDALDYAHSRQTVHRDIKPANILIDSHGEVKLVDFGLAEILATNAYAGGAGTYAYMAPEDFAEEDRSDSQSDIWAAGVTLFEMLTGERPFLVSRVKDPFAWKRALEEQSPRPLSQFLTGAPEELTEALNRALARDKRIRYQTAGAFRDDLERIRGGDPAMARTVRQHEPRMGPAGEGELRRGNGRLDDGEPAHRMPGVLVAELPAAPARTPAGTEGKRALFRGRRRAAKLSVSPSAIDFGAIRKGDSANARFVARVAGLSEPSVSRVATTADWLTVEPSMFDRERQAITLTAHSDRVWQTGDFDDTIRVESGAGSADVPVHMTVVKARLLFSEVAIWYLPLYILALLPALSVAAQSGAAVSAGLVPAAAVATGLLSLMLLFVAAAADTGMAEQVACAILTAAMCLVLGVTLRRLNLHEAARLQPVQRATLTGAILGGVLLLQLLHLKKWKLWAAVLGVLSLMMCGAFYHLLIR